MTSQAPAIKASEVAASTAPVVSASQAALAEPRSSEAKESPGLASRPPTAAPSEPKAPPRAPAGQDMAVVLGRLLKVARSTFATAADKANQDRCDDYSKVLDGTSAEFVEADVKYFVTSHRKQLMDKKFEGIILRYDPQDSSPDNPQLDLTLAYATATTLRERKEAELKDQPPAARARAYELLYADGILLNVYRLCCQVERDNEMFQKELAALESKLGINKSEAKAGQPFSMEPELMQNVSSILGRVMTDPGMATVLSDIDQKARQLRKPEDAIALFMQSIGNPDFMGRIGSIFNSELKM